MKKLILLLGVLTSCAASKPHKCDAYGLNNTDKNLEYSKTITTFDKV